MTETLNFENPEIQQRELSYKEVEFLGNLQSRFIDNLLINNDIDPALKKLCLDIETVFDNCVASIMQFSSDEQNLSVRMAPTLSPEAISALNTLRVGEGSCGNAVFHNSSMFVSNTDIDARWENVREFAFNHRVRSCWSSPVINGDKQVIGTIALSFFNPRSPDQFAVEVMHTAAKLIAMATMGESRERQLRHLAHTDSLTGLANRAMLDLTLEHCIERARLKKTAIAVVFMDLDGFKQVNDNYGHSTGDKLLRSIARYMEEAIAGEHFLARYGGDEFILLLEDDYWSETVESLVYRLSRCVDQAAQEHKVEQAIGISFGISHFPDDAQSTSDLIRLADSAMLERKTFNRTANRPTPQES